MDTSSGEEWDKEKREKVERMDWQTKCLELFVFSCWWDHWQTKLDDDGDL